VLSANNTAPNHQCSIVDADPDPARHFDADPDPAFHFDTDPDPTFQFDADPCGSGSGSTTLQHCTNEAVTPSLKADNKVLKTYFSFF